MQENESPDDYNEVIMLVVHKVKGLEFNCTVLINDDFHFGAIKSNVINREWHCNEANILYVVITRAKHHLYLMKKAETFLQQVSELDHVQVQLPAMSNLESTRQKSLDEWKRK